MRWNCFCVPSLILSDDHEIILISEKGSLFAQKLSENLLLLAGLRLILNGSRELQCGWKTVEIHGFPGNVPDRFFRVGLQNEYIF